MSEPRPERGALERLAEIAATAGGGLLGYGIGGAAGAVVGASATPAMTLAVDLGRIAYTARVARGADALERACLQMGTDLDTLAVRATRSDAHLELLARVLEAAGRSPLDAKIQALGRVLAAGLTEEDAAVVDEALLLANALDSIDAPHAQVLEVLGGPRGVPAADRGHNAGIEPGVLHPQLPGHRALLDSILHALALAFQ